MASFGIRSWEGTLRWVTLLALLFGLCSFNSVAWAYTLSGTVTNSSGKTGRIYLFVGTPQYGTSIDSAGAFTIRGVPARAYQVKAVMDTRGDGRLFATDPTGTSSTFTVASANVGGISVNLTNPAVPAPPTPSFLVVWPGDSSAALMWDREAEEKSSLPLADHYNLYWSTSPSVAPGNTVGGGSRLGIPHPGYGPVFQPGLTNGTTLYFVVTAVTKGVEGAPSPVFGPVSIGSSSPGGVSVQGTVSLPGITCTGPLYMVLFDGGNGKLQYIAAPTTAAQPFRFDNVGNGAYRIFLVLDNNNNGVLDAGDLTSDLRGDPIIAVQAAPVSGLSLSLSELNYAADVRTDDGSVGFTAFSQRKLVTRVSVESGPGLSEPIDVPWDIMYFDTWHFSPPNPRVGDTYNLTIRYADGTVETPSVAITDVLRNASPNSPAGASSGTAPLMSWTPPSPLPAHSPFLYHIAVYDPDWNTVWEYTVPSIRTSVTYNEDGAGTALVSGAQYYWEVQVEDRYKNKSGASGVFFTPTAAVPDFTISSVPAALSIIKGESKNATISSTGSGGFSGSIGLAASGLPDGMTASFNPASIAAPGSGGAVLTLTAGATTPTGVYTITITGTSGSKSHSTTVSLTVNPPQPTISGTPATAANVGSPYSFIPTASFATSFSLTGTLPPGLSFIAGTGALTGTPTTAGRYDNIVITAMNSSGSAALPAFSITVNPPLPTISGTPVTSVSVGTAYSFTPTATSATSFGMTGSLPPGLSFSTATGALSGTPTTVGNYSNIIISVSNSSGSAALPAFTITVTPPPPTISGTPTVSVVLGTAYNFTPTAANATSFSISGPIPPGLSFNSATGALTGTPTAVGSYNDILISASNSGGTVALPAFFIMVYQPHQNPTTIWQQTSGPETGNIMAFAIDPTTPSTMYAGSWTGGVFKSVNGGNNWSKVGTGLTSNYVAALVVVPGIPSIVYAGTGNGVFKSSDGGNSWIGAGLAGTTTYALAIDPVTPATLYAGTYGGVFKSINGGTSWTLQTGLPATQVTVLAVDPGTPAVVYAGLYSDGVYKSIDGGNSWNQVIAGLTNTSVHALAIDPGSTTTIYAGTWGGGVYKSTDGGNSWNQSSNTGWNLYVNTLAVQQNPSIVYAGGDGVFKSTDHGGTWSQLSTGLTNRNVRTISINPASPAIIYLGTYGGGVYKSTNGGDTWNTSNSGLRCSWILTQAIDPVTPTNIYGGAYNGGVFRSNDAGSSWSRVGLSGEYVDALAIDPETPTTVYAGVNGAGVFKSTNGGDSWSQINNGLASTSVQALVLDPSSHTTVFAGTWGGGVYKTTDGGNNWSPINFGLTSNRVRGLVIAPGNPATVYARTYDGGIFKSTSGGNSWTLLDFSTASNFLLALVIDPITADTLYVGTNGNGIYKSTNGGTSWHQINTGLTGTYVYALAVDPITPTTIYASASGGVHISTNGGASWSLDNSGLTGATVYSFVFDPKSPSNVYAGTEGGGVFKGGTHLDAPTISGTPATTTYVGNAYSFAPTATFADSFSITGTLPPGLSFDTTTGTLAGTPTTTGSYGNIVITATNGFASAALPAFTITVNPPSLSVTLSGPGSGSVNSIPSGLIACSWSPLSGTCWTNQPDGTTVTLVPAPSRDSNFGGWSGACTSASGNCTISLNGFKTVTGTFILAHKAMIGDTGYPSLGAAYLGAGNGATIRLLDVELTENLAVKKTLILEGGYNTSFTTRTGQSTTLKGKLTINAGRLTVNRIEVR